ncbi:capsid maturation protease [Mycobacterium phage Hopey]|nr:capsid maturation protease [Mycobacterium phage Hopey]QXN74575.1 capsid maturation protease [Mycobacterium phage JeTaime]
MDLITKALATIDQSAEKDYGPNGGFTAVLSTPSMDRDGDSLKRHEWKEPLPDRVPLDVDHGMSVATTVGSFHPYFEGDKLMMDAYFSSLKQAQDVRTLVDEGHISTVSVAFMNDRGAMKDGTPHRELLNAGIVAIPSNRDAVILQSKALDTRAQELAHEKVLEKAAGAGNGDTALLQAIHDAAVHLGAECAACDELHASDVPPPAPGADPAAAAKPPAKPAAEKKPPPKSVEAFVVAKSISGSVEDLTDRLTQALCSDAPVDAWAWVRATFLTDSKSGTVVYTVEDGRGGRDGTYARDFADDGQTVSLMGDPRPVSLVTSVVEKSTKSVNKAESKSTIEVEVPEGEDLEAFKARLEGLLNPQTPDLPDEAGTPQDSTEESPADEEPAPVDETAAASEEAAEEPEEVVVEEPSLFETHGEMLAFASSFSGL